MICRTPTRRFAPARRAFTIVELLVVTVVVLILMSILVAASSIATDTFRSAKTQGDFVGQQRMALSVLRRDLQYNHFLEEDGKPNLGRKLSDQNTDQLTWYNATPAPAAPTYRTRGYKPPRSGYFFASSYPAPATPASNQAWNINAPSTWNFSEGMDNDFFQSSRSANHILQFTIIVPGGAPEDTITADVPYQNTPATSSYPIIGRAAEVAYFLVPNGATPSGVRQYKLIRRQRLAAMNDDDRPAYTSIVNASLPGMSPNDPPEVMAYLKGQVLHLNDLTLAANRGPLTPIATYRIGEDVLLTNVTSFEIKFTGPQAIGVSWPSDPTSTTWPRPFAVNTDYPYDNLPYDGNYDTFNSTQAGWDNAANLAPGGSKPSPTGSSASPQKPIRITGVMIRLRCWNSATKGTRQTTIQVDL